LRCLALAGALGATKRWANRPTFHQLMAFGGHR
jgi:hypothetical protein